jgi:hypothetical protein
MRKVLLFALSVLLLADLGAANKSKPISSIPFEVVGSYVVIRVKINDSSPLNLILDSGIRNTIITELQEGDHITLNYSTVKDLMGLGGGTHLEAYSSNFNTLKIGKLKLDAKTVLVLKEDAFNLSKHTGTKINGMIGVDFFQDYIIEVSYTAKRVYFYDQRSFIVPNGYEMTPLTIEGQKIFVGLSVLEADSVKRHVKMLIDTGAELNAWFQTFKTGSVHIPPKFICGTIGQGLNGEIVGKIGRMPRICFGNHCLPNPIVSFPDSVSIADIIQNSDRDGTIGSQILSRFNFIIDYQQKLFYFKPNYNFTSKFYYNVSGIELTQVFPNFPQTEVWKVWKGSPADKAGVHEGDLIMEVNGKKSYELNINEIRSIFETPTKYPMRIKISRENKEIQLDVEMNSQI